MNPPRISRPRPRSTRRRTSGSGGPARHLPETVETGRSDSPVPPDPQSGPRRPAAAHPPTAHRGRAHPILALFLAAALAALAGGCTGDAGPADDAVNASPAPAAPADGDPQGTGAEGAAGEEGGPAAGPQPVAPTGPANPDPGLDPDPYRVDEMEDGEVDDRDMAQDGEPLVPRGFEDVAPDDGELVDGPFTDDDEGDAGGREEEGGGTRQDGPDAEGADGEDAAAMEPATLETVWVYLVEPAEEPPASARGRGEAGSGERRRPPTQNNGQYAGSFGCGDRLVGLEVELAEPVEVASREEHLRTVLQTLLDLEPEDVPGDLTTSLRRSPLQVETVEEAPGRPGVYQVRLSGPLRVAGTCENPRVRAQLTATGEQVEGVDEVEVFLGEEPLEVILSTRGTVR